MGSVKQLCLPQLGKQVASFSKILQILQIKYFKIYLILRIILFEI